MADRIQAKRNPQLEKKMREARYRKQQRKKRIFLLIQVVFIGLILIFIVNIMSRLKRIEKAVGLTEHSSAGLPMEIIEISKDAVDDVTETDIGNIPEYARTCEVGEIEKPIKREGVQILEKLAELGETDARIAEILEKADLYPDKLLEALANNPEMADFVSGYLNNKTAGETGLTKEEMQMEYPLFLQWDPRWGYQSYGDSNLAVAGCGPTSLSMALYYLTGDESLTPGVIADYAMENNYYMYGTGTLWALMDEAPIYYGVSSWTMEPEMFSMKQALDNGQILITSMRPGDFTAGGHFIVIYGYDETGFLVNDANCVARSRQTWSFEQLESQIKQMWVLSK